MEFYSAISKNEILSFAGKWMELENVILCEVGQVQKVNAFSHMWNIDTIQIQAILFLKKAHTKRTSLTREGG
jgi:hypothetical protein